MYKFTPYIFFLNFYFPSSLILNFIVAIQIYPLVIFNDFFFSLLLLVVMVVFCVLCILTHLGISGSIFVLRFIVVFLRKDSEYVHSALICKPSSMIHPNEDSVKYTSVGKCQAPDCPGGNAILVLLHLRIKSGWGNILLLHSCSSRPCQKLTFLNLHCRRKEIHWNALVSVGSFLTSQRVSRHK